MIGFIDIMCSYTRSTVNTVRAEPFIYKAYPPPLYQIIKGSALTVFTVDLA
jgi:hypothetical protein